MSFSSEIKEELSKINNLKRQTSCLLQLIGYLITKNTKLERKIKFSTRENEYNINRFSKLLNNMNIEYKIEMQGNLYVITFSKTENIKNCNFNSDSISFNKIEEIEEKDIKALLRGAFLGAGFISEPNNTYHLEINFSKMENLVLVKELLEKYGISLRY